MRNDDDLELDFDADPEAESDAELDQDDLLIDDPITVTYSESVIEYDDPSGTDDVAEIPPSRPAPQPKAAKPAAPPPPAHRKIPTSGKRNGAGFPVTRHQCIFRK